MLAKQIKALLEKRAELYKSLEALISKAEEEEDRALTEDETKTFDQAKRDIEELDARLERLQEMERIAATRALPVEPAPTPAPSLPAQPRQLPALSTLPKGAFFARLAHVIYASRQFQMSPIEYAAREMKDEPFSMVLRAAVAPALTSTPAWAGELVQQLITDFIDMLRPASIYARVPATTVQFDGYGSIKIPRRTTGTPGSWVGEGAPIPVKAGAFDNVQLVPKKMGVITVASKEMLARSTPALEALLRDGMLEDTAVVLDATFIGTAAGTTTTPAGLFHTSNAVAAIAGSTATPDADAALADSAALVGAMLTANVPMSRPVWLMNPATRLALTTMRNGVGAFYFRDEVNAGSWMGFPIIDSTTMPRTRLALVDASQLIKGIGFAPEIAMSNEAALQLDDAPASPQTSLTSMFQTDMTALRLTMEASWVTRRLIGVQWINDLSW
jgi:HK97 family phage major capsid protein